MAEPFWKFKFDDSSSFIDTFDEAPFWSAAFGLLLFKHLKIKKYSRVLDLGSGAGFPLFELAERLGKSSQCYGLDPWKNANERAGKKLKNYDVTNVSIIEGSALSMPFDDNSIDLIVSNLGVNNFEEPVKVIEECCRVMKAGATLSLTTNLNGHWKEFYDVFEKTLSRCGKPEQVTQLQLQQEHRGSVQSVRELLTKGRLNVVKCVEDQIEMRFADGSAFLNHHFIKVGWLSSWQALIAEAEWEYIFTELEKDLNSYAEQIGELKLTVPMLYIEAKK